MFDQLGEGVFRRRYESFDLNIGVVIGVDGVLIVDTRASHRQADELIAELRALTSLPVRWVVDTHWHWDHSFGNARFPDAEIWGHERCAEALSQQGDLMKEGAKTWVAPENHPEIDEVIVTPPNQTFSTSASLSIGREVSLSYHGLGHTDADILISVADAGVTFVGDLVEESAPPYFGDGYPLTWPLTMRLAMESMQATVVPGHGDVVDVDFVRSQREELVSVAELATSVIEGELVIEEAALLGPYPDEVMTTAIQRAVAVAGG